MAALRGALGFAAVSLGGFGVWAFAGRWLARRLGELGLYAACALVFVGLAGALLFPLVKGEQRLRRFCQAFVPAFLGYAAVWTLCWMALKFGAGEWLGSFAGTLAFAVILGKCLGSWRGLLKVALILFVGHSAGYFLGGIIYMKLAHPPVAIAGLNKSQVALLAKLIWGICYGLGFGAGIGFAFDTFQSRTARAAATAEKKS
jgi:hypothetical protein